MERAQLAAIAGRGTKHPSPEAVRDQVERILDSELFVESSKTSDLLRYLVELALNSKQVNEYSIGVDVFHRKETFDPRIDPSVRVQVGRLRCKLNSYYSTCGAHDGVEIELPRRTYMPVFRVRPPKAGATGAVSTSVAVRPFRCLSSDPGDQYLCDGLAEELIHAMASVKALRVIALRAIDGDERRSNSRDLRERLNVQAILEGSLRKAEDRLRISAQLSDVNDGTLIWSEIYDCRVVDVFAFQEEVAGAIVHALQTRTDLGERGTRE